MDPSSRIFKSKLRKRFYRKYDLHLGDLIKSEDVSMGQFYGLSTKGIGTKITVLYWPCELTQGKEIKELPKTHRESGIEVRVMYEPIS